MPPPGMHTHRRGLGPGLWGTKTSTAIRSQPGGATALTSTSTVDRRTLIGAKFSPTTRLMDNDHVGGETGTPSHGAAARSAVLRRLAVHRHRKDRLRVAVPDAAIRLGVGL